jgi:dCMP deaminase
MMKIGSRPVYEWDYRYLELAKNISRWSKDPSTKVGAVTVGKQGQILSQGFNGFPRNIDDSDERLNDRPTKLKYVVHAEMNCIYNACLNGVSLKDSDLYVYGLPVCSDCAKGVIQVGVKRVFMCYPTNVVDKWQASFEDTKMMFDEAGIRYNTYVGT